MHHRIVKISAANGQNLEAEQLLPEQAVRSAMTCLTQYTSHLPGHSHPAKVGRTASLADSLRT
jgi:hypothetical protein